MYKIDKNNLSIINEPDYKWPFWIVLAMLAMCLVYFGSKEKEYRINHITTIDTVYVKDVPLNDSSIIKELNRLGCVLPNVALAQFKIETAHFTSPICRENKNIAGIRNSASPLSIGKNRGHNVYESYRDCMRDYVRIQNKYLKNIDGKYAEASGYVDLIKSVK